MVYRYGELVLVSLLHEVLFSSQNRTYAIQT